MSETSSTLLIASGLANLLFGLALGTIIAFFGLLTLGLGLIFLVWPAVVLLLGAIEIGTGLACLSSGSQPTAGAGIILAVCDFCTGNWLSMGLDIGAAALSGPGQRQLG